MGNKVYMNETRPPKGSPERRMLDHLDFVTETSELDNTNLSYLDQGYHKHELQRGNRRYPKCKRCGKPMSQWRASDECPDRRASKK